MFISTMNDAEIQQEARKDFFELSTKVRIAAERFMRMHFDLAKNSRLQYNDIPVSLIQKAGETKKWRTRKNNIWTSLFRLTNKTAGIEMECFLYTPVYRTNGTEYIFLGDFKNPIAERFTLHFIERYKERYLKPRGIDIGGTPAPLYFQIHNQDCIKGCYYKTTDLDIAEGKHKRFWIAPQGIYVTDYIDGMLTYITFMDKEGLSPLKRQVYEEEIVWNLMTRLIDEKRSRDDQIKAAFSLAYNSDIGPIFERFTKRNVEDDDNGDKQRLILYAREKIAELQDVIRDNKIKLEQKDKEYFRKYKITGTLNMSSGDEIKIKEYDLNRVKGE